MPLIYGEGVESAFRRLRREVEVSLEGRKHETFFVTYALGGVALVAYFTARAEELEEIHQDLRSNGRRRMVTLTGLGGIGKTQLAIQYATRHQDGYSAIFWLNIKDEDSLAQSFVSFARRILRQHGSARFLSQVSLQHKAGEVIVAVKAWLSQKDNTRWLLIFDNYDDPMVPGHTGASSVDIRQYLIKAYQGCIVVTTRSWQVDFGHRMRIGKLEQLVDSLESLSATSKWRGVLDDLAAMAVARELDGLPLALATAGAYLRQAPVTSSTYVGLYHASWRKLQKTSSELSSYEDRTLYSTWQISYDHVQRRSATTTQVLRFRAYMDNRDIWFELVRHTDNDDPEWIWTLAEDEMSFHGAMRVLTDYGLVDADPTSPEQIESGRVQYAQLCAFLDVACAEPGLGSCTGGFNLETGRITRARRQCG